MILLRITYIDEIPWAFEITAANVQRRVHGCRCLHPDIFAEGANDQRQPSHLVDHPASTLHPPWSNPWHHAAVLASQQQTALVPALRSMLATTWLAKVSATPICLRASREVEQRVG
jgi:hypothetical protein